MKYIALIITLAAVCTLSACSDEGGSATESGADYTRQSSTSHLLNGLDSGDAEIRRYCALQISLRVESNGERPPTDRLNELFRDADEDPVTRYSCGVAVMHITNDKQSLRQPMLDLLTVSIHPSRILYSELGVSLEEAMPYLEQLRENDPEQGIYIDDMIENWEVYAQ